MKKLRLLPRDELGSNEAGQRLDFPELQNALIQHLCSGEGGAVDFIDVTLQQAVLHRASDVHIEPWADTVAVRFRIDGILHDVAQVSKEFHPQIVARTKVLARLVVYQRDVPQEGRIDTEATPCRRGLRVSTFPTVQGEKLIFRILSSADGMLRLTELGFNDATTTSLQRFIGQGQGTLLLTGPSSSGKTTTIYALLQEILEHRSPTPHVVTIEDPVEYKLSRIAQTEVNPHAGFTFECALRSALRQDPEVIVVGEIRDAETARIAVQAGLTGHLVISTIHCGTAAGVFTRLIDMGVEPFLVASSITGVLAQRLVRSYCPHCGARAPVRTACTACQSIGYLGRTAIGELLQMNAEIANLVMAKERTSVIEDSAVRTGMVPLARDGALRVERGVTSTEEVARVLSSGVVP